MPEVALEQLQRWMSLIIRHPEDAEAGTHTDDARALIPRGPVAAGEIVKPNDRMTPFARLDVYNGGYLSRLIEVLESDFDAVQHALGDDGWFEVAKRFVYAHPSRHPNLNQFGAGLAAFIAEQEDLEHRAFVSDLARLQRTVSESFDSPEFEALDMESLRSLTQEQWAGVVLVTNPSVRLEKFDYPTNRYLQAYFDGKKPELPEPEPTWVVAYRKEGRVWRLTLPEPIAAILAALMAGTPFAEALEAGGGHEDVGQWFQEWSADGLFVRANVPD